MEKQRILIFGGTGMLGHKLVQMLSGQFDVWTTVRGRFEGLEKFGIYDPARVIEGVDAADPETARRSIESVRPDTVINAVGIIKQLPTANDVIQTLTINSIFPHRLVEWSLKYGFRTICISTDCVFSGKTGLYKEEDVSDAYDLYGKSKNLGEVTEGDCVTVRTSIIGRELGTSHSLVDWFLSNRGGSVRGYANAIYSGFPTVVFTDIIVDLITKYRNLRGLYHISSEPINKYDLLKLVNEKYNAGITIERDESFRIDRSLDSTKFRKETGYTPPSWDDMISRMAADPTPYDIWKK